jgi:hypothetical protein
MSPFPNGYINLMLIALAVLVVIIAFSLLIR